jgi:hypothetical protein
MRITPRRVVALIELSYEWTQQRGNENLGPDQAPVLGMILATSRQIPAELLPSDADGFTALQASLAAIQVALDQWAGIGYSAGASPLAPLRAFAGRSPVKVIRDVLATCPEEGVVPEIRGLEFVTDVALRESLRRDLSASRAALESGSYKAATVLAGAVIEALLLDALEGQDARTRTAALAKWHAAAGPTDAAPAKLKPEISRWGLHELVWIAAHSGVISEEAASAADVARDFRNLIHPGRERLSVPSGEGTAYSALGAALRVAEELAAHA